ncbi:choice-of-anchor Q domain-containing protein [Haloferula sp.]|uniref:choice-of-anchor Q domain-containing protein n=1 Tax=Haloferula sp. TaxID=2497595 RepID=UPI00329F1D94
MKTHPFALSNASCLLRATCSRSVAKPFRALLALAAAALPATSLASTTIYVDATATTGNEDGSSWADAYLTVQDAIVGLSGPDVEVWIAEGTYYPDEGGGQSDNNRNATFNIPDGVLLIGGFPDDGSASSVNDADPTANPTILSGDLDQNDGAGEPTGNNAYHVVTATSTGAGTGLQGLIIENGRASGSNTATRRGAGLDLNAATFSIADCIIRNCRVSSEGGGMHVRSSSNVTVTGTTLTNNAVNLFFDDGGGVYSTGSTLDFTNCRFTGNKAKAGGGGALLTNSTVSMTNCLFSGNEVDGNGGAISNFSGSTLTLVNTTIANNIGQGAMGGIRNGANVVATNTLMWGNTDSSGGFYEDSSFSGSLANLTANHSLIQGRDLTGMGTGNFDGTQLGNNPLFVDPIDPATAPTTLGDYRIGQSSLAIDVGDNTANLEPTDLNGDPRIQNGIIDLGTFEGGVPTASADPTSDVLVYAPSQPDMNTDAYDLSSIFTDPTGVNGLTYLLESNSDTSFITAVNVDPDGTVDITLGTHTGIAVLLFSADNTLGKAFFQLTVSRQYGTIFVDADDALPGDGLSWASSFPRLQDALAVAVEGDEIWIAEGSYYPDEGGGKVDNDREAGFTIPDGISLYGGLVGNEASLAGRDPVANPTILSGDIDGNDTTIGGVTASADDINGGNSYHVVNMIAGTLDPASGIPDLDGLIITGGAADGSEDLSIGGGLYVFTNDSSMDFEFHDCVFQGNLADGDGGGVYMNGNVLFDGCHFIGNQSGDDGAGLYRDSGDTIVMTDCLFQSNLAGAAGIIVPAPGSSEIFSGGGGAHLRGDHELTHCRFEGNETADSGGGLLLDGNGTLDSCLFVGNRAGAAGGGMLSQGQSVDCINATFSGNLAGAGGGGLSPVGEGASINLINCIFWSNLALNPSTTAGNSVETYFDGADPDPTYTVAEFIDYTLEDASNLDGTDPANDPLLVLELDPATAPTTGGDHRLLTSSPALDAGDNSASTVLTDLAGNPRIQNTTIDLGAYEGSFVTFALLGFSNPDGDDNHNGITNFGDYAAGGDPTAPDDPTLRPQLTGNQLTFSFRNNAADVVTEFQKSDNLVDWFKMSEGLDYSVNDTTVLGAQTTQTLDLLTTDPKLFFREEFTNP